MEENLVILHVEDDMEHAQLVHHAFKRKGIQNEYILFTSGEEILNFLFKQGNGAHRTDGMDYLILLDIALPNMDGIEVLRRIKESDDLKDIPVIMLTASDDEISIDKCHELGCSLYISKPMDVLEFVEILNQFGIFLKMVMQI